MGAETLGKLPFSLLEEAQALPAKGEQVDWERYHSRNARAFGAPLDRRRTVYAIDDLHRLDYLLRFASLDREALFLARLTSRDMLQRLKRDPYGLQSLGETHKRIVKARSDKLKLSRVVQV